MKTTPLYHRHLELGAKMTEFAGYQMPVRYTGDKLEHMAVREKAGIFDVSHMGEVWVTGPKAEAAMSRLLNQDVSKYKPGRAFYALLLNHSLGIVDDVIAYKFSSEKFLICVNAANRAKDFEWINLILAKTIPPLQLLERGLGGEVCIEDASDDWAQIAIQGPKAREIVEKSPLAPLFQRGEIKRFHFLEAGDLIIARTGYTGEDGFEIFCPNTKAIEIWNALLKKATPCGLAARDTLRLEAGLCLYGHELNDQTTPWEAGLGWCVNLSPKEIKRRLVGLIMQNQAIARADYEVCKKTGEKIGRVTSGTKTPFLNQAIAMAYVDSPYCDAATPVYVKVRGQLCPAQICKLPFYRRST